MDPTISRYFILLTITLLFLIGISNCDVASSSRREVDAMASLRSRCVNCVVNGQRHEGHSRFQFEDGCQKFRCTCYCNGTWECPPQYTENLCSDNNSHWNRQGSSSSSSPITGRVDGGCRSCVVNGQEHPGNAYFRHVSGCITNDACVCYCNGTWDCPATRARNTCETEDPSTDSQRGEETRRTENLVEDQEKQREEEERRRQEEERKREDRRRLQCSNCTVYDKDFRGNTYFQVDQGCIKYKYCFCYCNGSWNCPAKHAERTCNEEEEKSEDCLSCVIKGKTFESNSNFELTSNCIHYKNCACKCDGSWSCSESGAKKVCEREGNVMVPLSGQSCSSCSVRGKQYPGNEYFEFSEGCMEYKSCICNCDGSWKCPDSGARNICARGESATTEAASSERGCQDCNVRGKQFAGNDYFDFTEGCMEYKNCICNCNGSWNCPDSGAKNICAREDYKSPKVDDRCRTCDVKGKVFAGNSYFDTTVDCTEYKNCVCNCDGSWRCPESSAKNICSETSKQPPVTGACKVCDVKGQRYAGNDYFDYRDGCTEYRNCICNCDGSWACPPNAARNICEETDSSCKTCEVYGATFPGNEYFQVKQGCYEYKNCICYCNGSWICPDNSVRYTCSNDVTQTTKAPLQECKSCTAYGLKFRGNTIFNVTNGCMSYKNCQCRCSGSWQCPPSSAINTCLDESRTESLRPQPTQPTNTEDATAQCRNCNIKNKLVKGNTRFEHRDGCIEYQNCVCRCDGSWQCPSQYAKNICPAPNTTSEETCRTCMAKGKIVKGNSFFELTEGCTHYRDCRCNCDGSWQCPSQRAQNICFDRDSTCSLCEASNGQVFQPNSPFTFTQDCIQYQCDCYCNGSWNCPAEKSKWACTDKCLQCNVDGKKMQNGTDFNYKKGCLEYSCHCFCNGSWYCPGSTVRNTCPVGVNDNCNTCKVGEEEYEGETDFELRRDCLQYKCRCNCDGTYSCPGKEARNVCRGETLGGCRSCVVSESEYYRGDSNFTLKKDCLHYSCRCNCDGSWSCPGELARDVCLGEVPGGCRVCRVSDSERYMANTVFDLKKGCISYRCKCNCDGSWSCPGEDARDVCKGEIPGGCRSCVISENEFYPGNSNFEMVKNCLHYKCRCNCDGGYSCPGKQARRVCKSEGEIERPSCKSCKISESEQFQANSTFHLERGCNRYECTCNCDGSWLCPATKTRDICSKPSSAAQCKHCKIGTEVYPGNSAFKFTRRCNQFACECACSGRWSCDMRNPVNICLKKEQDSAKTLKAGSSENRGRQTLTSNSQTAVQSVQSGANDAETDIRSLQRDMYKVTTSSPAEISHCRLCVIDGKTLRQNELFSVSRGCSHYRNCMCNCNGTWQCEEETNNCEGGLRVSSSSSSSVHIGREGQSGTRKNTVEVDSSAWVYVDGKDSSFVQKKDDQTGGGYSVQVDTKYKPVVAHEAGNSQPGGQLDARFVSSGYSPDRTSSYSVSHSYISEDSGSSEERSGQCQPCEVDSRTYRAGAHFDMRRECVIYKCTCLCNGNYRCRLTSDNACTSRDKESSCGNCVYKGLVFPGSRGFTVRDDCYEKECKCNCDGTHECHKLTPIVGCTADSSQSSRFFGVGNPYFVQPVVFPASHSVITKTESVVFTGTCPNCGAANSGGVVYPQNGHGGGGFALLPPTEYKPVGECSGCSIDGNLKAGNSTFTFVKECIEFNCFCACGGSWKCSGVQALECTPGYETGSVLYQPGCRNCNVKDTEYPGNSRFTLQEGCNQYQCTCSCNGQWLCPRQQPVNVCPPESRREQRGRELDPLVARDEPYASDQSTEKRASYDMVGELRQLESGSQLTNGALKTDTSAQYVASGLPSARVSIGDRSASRSSVLAVEAGDYLNEASFPGCRPCDVDGERIAALSTFIRQLGCSESVCKCQCDGTASCPSSATVNVCGLSDKKPMNERKGCVVGKRTFLTRVFPHVESCRQRTCICHDDSTWTCQESPDDLKVC